MLSLAAVAAISYFEVEETQVPDVTGMPLEEAFRTLRQAELEVRSYPENVPGQPADQIINQNPVAGAVVRRGRSVTLGVNNPPADTRVPTLTGRQEAELETMLADAGLTLGEVSYEYSSDPEGSVISQNPEGGSMLTSGESVAVVVSRGQELQRVTMPDVSGLSVNEARQQLSALGITRIDAVATSLSYDRPGRVSQQFPAANERVAVSTPVTLHYALSGRDVVRVPSVSGMDLQRAQQTLRAARLEVGWVEYVNDPDRPEGVISVEPSGYTLTGTPVSVRVNGSRSGDNVLRDLDSPASAQDSGDIGAPIGGDAEDVPEGTRRITINFSPNDYDFLRGREVEFKLVVIDDRGERTVIDRNLSEGASINTTVQVFGPAELQTFINGNPFQVWNP